METSTTFQKIYAFTPKEITVPELSRKQFTINKAVNRFGHVFNQWENLMGRTEIIVL